MTRCSFLRVLLLSFSALVFSLSGCGGIDVGDGPASTSGTFVALTYNVHGLPAVITQDDTGGRIKQIAPLLNAFDLVGVEEDWMDDQHAVLAEGCTLVTQTRYADKLEKRAYGTGLATFSRFKLLAQEGAHYSDCYGKLDHASDCLASKGFLFNRLELAPGVELDFYVTHLDAGGSKEDQAVRQKQVGELLAFMEKESEGRAVLFVGDLNLDYSKGGDEAALIDLIDSSAGLQRACVALDCSEPNHIDQHHFRSGGGLTLEPEVWKVEPAFFDPEGQPLSDHPAISVRYHWTHRAG